MAIHRGEEGSDILRWWIYRVKARGEDWGERVWVLIKCDDVYGDWCAREYHDLNCTAGCERWERVGTTKRDKILGNDRNLSGEIMTSWPSNHVWLFRLDQSDICVSLMTRAPRIKTYHYNYILIDVIVVYIIYFILLILIIISLKINK